MLKKAAALFFIGASSIIGLSCGKTENNFLYAAIPGSSQIAIYREDPNSGILTALVNSPFTAGPGVQSLVIHPSHKFLYAANSSEADISVFTIASDGTLTEITPRTSVGSGANTPTILAMDGGGNFLYVGNSGAAFPSFSVFSIDASSGNLTAVPGSPFATGITPLNIKVTPSGTTLYVSGPGNPGYIEVWSLASGVPSGQNPVVQVIRPGTNPYGLAVDPSGSYLYVANTGDASIGQYSISATDGTLTMIAPTFGQTILLPTSLLVDNSGKYLYVANNQSPGYVTAYGIGSNGSLTALTTSPFTTPANPVFIATDTSGKYLFVGNQGSGAVIQSFSVDSSTGALTSVASYAVGTTPSSIAVLP
jgi:6-phosphogluconolactonase (cycloisomerase 2 family)